MKRIWRHGKLKMQSDVEVERMINISLKLVYSVEIHEQTNNQNE